MQLVNHQTKTLILLLSSIAIRVSVRLSVRSHNYLKNHMSQNFLYNYRGLTTMQYVM